MLNLTPHAVTLRTPQGDVTIAPSGVVARVSTVETLTGDTVAGVLVVARTMGDVTGLPPEGTPCIVSAMVAAAVPGRAGVYAPDTGVTAVRDDRGQIVAVTRSPHARG
jgi:hypothetical protein